MPHTGFDDSTIDWQPFGDFPHFQFAILHVDRARNLADVLFRFAAGQQIVLHRHKALNHTFVLRGEHLIYEEDGSLREARPTGSYTISPASETPHREGGGKQDAIVLFSMRPEPGELLYEILDDAGRLIAEVTLDTLEALFNARLATNQEAVAA
ncbi:cupin domain-containing protein [Zoogloea dura]|uniref:Regulator n=1 Tax=Zoogloea dura TaxID=2728840 RepID=A0A848G7W2_9RHOO|nr:regulator [Zoogloea dura]NML27252.1 regulator [Zoogloea dura]